MFYEPASATTRRGSGETRTGGTRCLYRAAGHHHLPDQVLQCGFRHRRGGPR
ncbi:MAG: hypothetical protein MZV64_29785 [Ignavibacteriales bacterium]|nr:hypothetical protein [Ignavibacteriales bacterium]